MAFTLPPLPYDYAALEPHIDEQTMRIHHDKHHAAYVNNLNTALEAHGRPAGEERSTPCWAILRRCPRRSGWPCATTAAGTGNHTMFWEIMAPGGAKEPQGALAAAIDKAFGSFAPFKEQFARRRVSAASAAAGPGSCRWPSGSVDHREHPQPGQSPDGRQEDAAPRLRRLGARLLPQVPEPPPRLRGARGGTW